MAAGPMGSSRLLGTALAWAGAGLLLAGIPPARAAAPDGASGDRLFVSGVVSAINSKSVEKRVALLHSQSLACVRADNDSIYRDLFARQARRHIPPTYRFTITAVKKGEPPPFADLFQYPVIPTHVLELTFDTGPTSSTTLVLQLAREKGAWREVVGCPKPGTAALMRVAREERLRESRHAQDLAARISPSLRDSIMTMFRNGRRIEAYQAYAASSGEDLATAKQVVDLLADRAHLPR
jgi:hypothetical protein